MKGTLLGKQSTFSGATPLLFNGFCLHFVDKFDAHILGPFRKWTISLFRKIFVRNFGDLYKRPWKPAALSIEVLLRTWRKHVVR